MSDKLKKDKKTVDASIGEELNFAVKEAYNLLRTNLEFSLPDKRGGAKVIGVTSSLPGDGKSYTAINLCYSIAKKGSKVLLVDCDLRRSSVSEKLSIEQVPGLSNFLSKGEDGAIKPSGLDDNFYVATAGDLPPNPSELLGSEKMKEFLDVVISDFDYVFCDLPPVLAVSDAAVVSKLLDGIVIVVRHNKTKRRELVEALRQLSYSNVKVLGFVYNGFYTGGASYSYKNYTKRENN